jgi:S-DNA-T family DNA segregation ATPase FtsK/SpoIIIE
VDEEGGGVAIGLVEHNLLLGGEPGAGKSGVMSMLVAAAALDSTASLWLMDGKLVELAPWRPVAAGFAGVEIDEAIVLLRTVKAEMDACFAELLDLGRRKVGEGTGLHVVVCDELAHYLTWPDKKARDAFSDALRDLVSRGRAAGVIVLAATQKPGSDVVPTSIRDLFGYRLAMRCSTAAASDTILGSGWAAEGYSAATIDPATRGVGLLLHESGVPAPMRAHWLHDGAIDDLATRARQLRGVDNGTR